MTTNSKRFAKGLVSAVVLAVLLFFVSAYPSDAQELDSYVGHEQVAQGDELAVTEQATLTNAVVTLVNESKQTLATISASATPGTSFSSNASGSKSFSRQVADSVKQRTDAGYTVSDWGGWPADSGTFGTKDVAYTITLKAPQTPPATTHQTIVKFVDEEGKQLALITGTGTEGTKYSVVGKSGQSLVSMVNSRIAELKKSRYEVKSSQFVESGSYKSYDENLTIVMKATNGAGTKQTIVIKYVDKYTKTTINYPSGREGVFNVGELTFSDGIAGQKLSASAFEAINSVRDEIIASGYTLVSSDGIDSSISFDYDTTTDQTYYMTFQGHITSVENPQDMIYNGSPLLGKPVVKQKNTVLQEGVDYKLSYKNNTNVGRATVSITGIGGFTGQTSTAQFTINPASIASATLELQPESYVFDGKAKKPTVLVQRAGKTLSVNKDYTLSYSNNVGSATANTTATVTIVGKGNYTGTKTASFTITAPQTTPEQKQSLTKAHMAAIPDQFYTSKQVLPKPTITLAGKTLKLGEDYTLSYVNNIKLGRAVITATGKGNYFQTLSATFNIVPEPVAMYRLYNPNSGEHFYTGSVYERDVLKKAGWRYEGIGWWAPKISTTPVYRLYNSNAGDHHYTINKAERNMLIGKGWRDEGIGWYSDDLGGVALYRQYNPNAKAGAHNYTTSKAENDHLVSVGWRYEGIAWYGLKMKK